MASPQRLNVLLSRARNALIMIGNADTFMNSRKSKEVWNPFMDQLKREGYIYHGFPIRCEQHPNKKAILSSKAEFNIVCPDGGCSEPWYVCSLATPKFLSPISRNYTSISHLCTNNGQRSHSKLWTAHVPTSVSSAPRSLQDGMQGNRHI